MVKKYRQQRLQLNKILDMKILILPILVLFSIGDVNSQGCCSGGSASPIAGGTSQGVLDKNQGEFALNNQLMNSQKFYAGDRDTASLFNELSSNYLYVRAAYGLSEKLTLSIESGYFLRKRQIALDNTDTMQTSGIADLIVFPRYQVFYSCDERQKTEIVLGIGIKIPIGIHNDSNVFYTDPISGKDYYQFSPPTVQLTNGSNDFIFYSFWYRNFQKKNFRIFANTIYVRKGWNSIGQKFGDYASIGLFFGTTVLKHLGLTGQIKGEMVRKMQTDKLVDMIAYYNVDPESTGGYNLFFTPQINYSNKRFNFFLSSDIPLYQYMNGVQVGSDFQLTSGISYKF
jgi:hypothetical protein